PQRMHASRSSPQLRGRPATVGEYMASPDFQRAAGVRSITRIRTKDGRLLYAADGQLYDSLEAIHWILGPDGTPMLHDEFVLPTLDEDEEEDEFLRHISFLKPR